MNYIGYDLKKGRTELSEIVELNIENILKKYNKEMYEMYSKYLKSNKTEEKYGNKVKNYIYKMYLKSLTKDDSRELKFLNKKIKKIFHELEFMFLVTFDETSALSIPPMQKNNMIIQGATKVILRDKDGFYSNDSNFQDRINNIEPIFKTLEGYLVNKEKIMNGNRINTSKILARGEIAFMANFLGYASIRDNVLESQKRNKEKILQKTKD